MKTFVMNWVVNPGIVVCFSTFLAIISLGLVDIVLINLFERQSDLSGGITPSGFFFGYCCAAFAINVDVIDRFFKR